MSQIQQRVTVSSELISILQQFRQIDERKIRELVGSAVDDSIVEILPPVVDRSVTIALITARELVLKDFAYDGDFQRVLQAADLIVQNLAGSLALVTCREPLRIHLNTNLRKVFEHQFKTQMGLEIIKSPAQINENEGLSHTESDKIRYDSNGFQLSVHEHQINEITMLASRENLELGCMLIKKKVIEKALRKVREDYQITQAVERRQRSAELGIRLFRDENIAS
jgi:hypothetical protein